MERYDKLVDNVRSLDKMLQDMGRLDETFLSLDDRDQITNSIISLEIDGIDRTIVREMLMYGYRGYDDMSDIELVERQLDVIICEDDDEFNYHLPNIEQAVNKKLDELISEQAEKMILTDE